jgi:hypothetical protein
MLLMFNDGNKQGFCFALKEGMITSVISVIKSLLHVPNSMNICTSTKVHGSDVMNVGGSFFARMHFVLIREFTQVNDLITVRSAARLSTPHQTSVFMNRYMHKFSLSIVSEGHCEIVFQDFI